MCWTRSQQWPSRKNRRRRWRRQNRQTMNEKSNQHEIHSTPRWRFGQLTIVRFATQPFGLTRKFEISRRPEVEFISFPQFAQFAIGANGNIKQWCSHSSLLRGMSNSLVAQWLNDDADPWTDSQHLIKLVLAFATVSTPRNTIQLTIAATLPLTALFCAEFASPISWIERRTSNRPKVSN